MNSRLILKEKTDARVIYYYSSESSFFENNSPIISDGEIEYDFEAKKMKTLKTATGDDGGLHAVWLRPYVYRVIVKENCPEKRFIAIG